LPDFCFYVCRPFSVSFSLLYYSFLLTNMLILSQIIPDDTRWQTVTRTNNGLLEEFTLSYQNLLPSTSYTFRVIAYNTYGISYPAYSNDAVNIFTLFFFFILFIPWIVLQIIYICQHTHTNCTEAEVTH
jgi:hypothetical protein